MENIIKRYKILNFEEAALLNCGFSVIWNICVAGFKLILSIFYGLFFIVSGIVNLFTALAKMQCVKGITKNDNFERRNKLTSIFLFISGLQYSIYMGSVIFFGRTLDEYGMVAGIFIALVSFIDLTLCIIDLFKVTNKDHYYRNMKIINFCGAMTSIILTMVALLSFASNKDNSLLCAICGVSVGSLIMLLSIFMYIAPKYSIYDKKYHSYKSISETEDKNIEIDLYFSKWYGGYTYIGKLENGVINGQIITRKNEIMKMNKMLLVLLIVLSEILIFVYAVGKIVSYIKCLNIIDKLDKIMKKNGYKKIENESNSY